MTTTHGSSRHPQREVDLATQLKRFEIARQEQLETLPNNCGDIVAAAYRASLQRTLSEVRTALKCLEDGRYGICVSCADPISVKRLELHPWAVRCTRCPEHAKW